MKQTLRYFLLWFPMIFIAVANGAVRELWLKKHMSDLVAHQISTISLIILFGIYIGLIIKKYPPKSEKQAFQIGLFWLVLTLIFEFGFGISSGHSWSQLFNDYNLIKGRVWIFVPIWITIAPYLAFRMDRQK